MTKHQQLLKKYAQDLVVWKARVAESHAQLRELIDVKNSPCAEYKHDDNGIFVPVIRDEHGAYISGGWMCYCRALDVLLKRTKEKEPVKPKKA